MAALSGQYILRGRDPIPVEDVVEWGRWYSENRRQRGVAFDVVGASRVSTVFIGLDHRLLGDGPPLIFETMVFGGPLDQAMDRYSTWDEAERGHAAMVERVRRANEARAR